MCWRHQLRLFVAAYGTILDITGREYLRRGNRIIEDSRNCGACQEKVAR